MSAKKRSGPRSRRKFTEQFKRDAANLVIVQGYSYSEAARAVEVGVSNIINWCKKYGPSPETPSGDGQTVHDLQEEVARLRKQLREAELEREILKKATAYFAKESQ